MAAIVEVVCGRYRCGGQMHGLGMLGIVILLIGNVWIAIKAFQQGILWGLGCLFIPLVSLIFVITHWAETKVPFIVSLAGVALVIFGR
jgi:hypothetical protein